MNTFSSQYTLGTQELQLTHVKLSSHPFGSTQYHPTGLASLKNMCSRIQFRDNLCQKRQQGVIFRLFQLGLFVCFLDSTTRVLFHPGPILTWRVALYAAGLLNCQLWAVLSSQVSAWPYTDTCL